MVSQGQLSPEAYDEALRYLGLRPDPHRWALFWRSVTATWGALFLASGIVCFFAWNWALMTAQNKFLLLGGIMAAMLGLALWRGLDSLTGRLALLLAALMPGPLLAVFGQTYQSGADMWELFRAWTLTALPLALAGRQAGLWLLVWVLASAWAGGWLESLPRDGHAFEDSSYMLWYMLGQALCVIAWEAAARHWGDKPEQKWLKAFWVPRLMATFHGIGLTMYVVAFFSESFFPDASGLNALAILIYAMALAAGWWWYRHKRRDLFMLSLGLFSLCCVAGGIANLNFPLFDLGGLLVMGMIVVALCTVAAKIVLGWQRALNAENAADPLYVEPTPRSFALFGPKRRWEEIWAHLRLNGLLTGPDTPIIPDETQSPWYVRVMLALGGWFSAQFLLAFLCLLLATTVIGRAARDDGTLILLISGLGALGVGRRLGRNATPYFEQFSLALSLAGLGSVALGIAFWANNTSLMLLLMAISTAAAYWFVPGAVFRCLTALMGLFLFFLGLETALMGYLPLNLKYHEGAGTLLTGTSLRFTAGFALCSLGLVYGWLHEGRWMPVAPKRALVEPLLHAIFLFLPLALVATSDIPDLPSLICPAGAVGVGAGIALVFLAWALAAHTSVATRSIYGGSAAAALLVGWHLPGLPLGLLGLTLSRWRGNAAGLGFTAVWLTAYVWHYYYNLKTTLLHKSLTLTVTGGLLLALSLAVRLLIKPNVHKDEAPPSPARTPAQTPHALVRCALAAAVCAAFLAGVAWTAHKQNTLLQDGRTVLLPLAPRDPRALLLGDYMVLRYAMDADLNRALKAQGHDTPTGVAVVRLDAHQVATFARLDDGSPLRQDEQRLRFRIRQGHASAGPSSFFFQEGFARALEQARYGELRVNTDGATLITHLRDTGLGRIEPQLVHAPAPEPPANP